TPGRNPADARWQVSRAGDSGAVAAGDLSLSARPEKLRKNRPTLLRQHPTLDLHPVVQPGLFQYLAAADDGTGAGFAGAEHQAGDAAVYQQAGAHGAGFEGDVEGGAGQAVVLFALG